MSTKTKTKPKTEAEEPELINGTPEQRTEATERARVCSVKLVELLEQHRCRITIVTQLIPKPIGVDGSELLITPQSGYGIEPLPVE